jgi:sulfate permease, SulP family
MGLLPSAKVGNPLTGINLDLLAQTDWHQLPAALPIISVIIVISIVGLLLNTTGAELALREDIDINRELRVTGLTNIGIGTFGGLGVLIGGLDHQCASAGANRPGRYCRILCGRPAGFLACRAECGGSAELHLGGLLLFIGISMINDWLLTSRKRLPSQDWGSLP